MRFGKRRNGIPGARWAAVCLCALLLSGCGAGQDSLPGPDNAAPDYSGIILEDDGIALTDAERDALLSQGELDRGLSKADLMEVIQSHGGVAFQGHGAVAVHVRHRAAV